MTSASSRVAGLFHRSADTYAPVGGRLSVSTFGRQDERWESFDEVFTPYLPPQMLDARTSGARGPFASDEGVEDLLRGAGMQGVRTEHRTVEAVFRDTEQYLTFTW